MTRITQIFHKISKIGQIKIQSGKMRNMKLLKKATVKVNSNRVISISKCSRVINIRAHRMILTPKLASYLIVIAVIMINRRAIRPSKPILKIWEIVNTIISNMTRKRGMIIDNSMLLKNLASKMNGNLSQEIRNRRIKIGNIASKT